MSSNQVLIKSKEIVEASKLQIHEAQISDSMWTEHIQMYIDACIYIKNILCNQSIIDNIPSSYTLILLGGILGNSYTTCKLYCSDKLVSLTKEILNIYLSKFNVKTTRQLLLLEFNQSSKVNSSTLASQILKLSVAYLSKSCEKSDDSLTHYPLVRDTLVWLAMELDYPELAGFEFISVLQPFGLRLTEDYRSSIQLVGLSVLRSLATKARIADWRQSNRAEAVISQLLDHRIACSPTSPEILLDEVYSTLLILTNLLSNTNSANWYEKITERLLFDLLMETRYKRQLVLLKHLLKLINTLKASFSLFTRQFIKVTSSILLGPRKSTCSDALATSSESNGYNTVYALMLQCVSEFVKSCWPLVCPTLLPDLIPILTAFVDLLSWDNKANTSKDEAFHNLKSLFESLIILEPRLLNDVLQPLCDTVPHLKLYIPC
ncbi:hypothetical protein EWB00_008104 [Schistosoma japonicum]|uniref:Uncharacterized protein n=1 Tax=Schistosoma japonicum TaxID=6182 RepID=A0A4Z2CRM8_SCHJA|nr:hypothetical protein EWB00_008104 [Schistosoma japonicum]